MQNQITFRDYNEADKMEVLNIFNFFAETSQAVLTNTKISTDRFNKLIEGAKVFLVLEQKEKIIGFGYLSTYKPYPNFKSSGVLTYFILNEYTSKGLGSLLISELINRGRAKGINNYLASISSLNEQSLNFHKKHGFNEVGRFKNIYEKFGNKIDIVWVQKIFD